MTGLVIAAPDFPFLAATADDKVCFEGEPCVPSLHEI